MAYLGYECSMLMSFYKQTPKRLMLSWLKIAAIFCIFSYPMYLLTPFNKKLFTPSYILASGAVSGIVLTFFYFIIDILAFNYPKVRRVV
jgi:predicted acyltransferase